jgi:hypothetical protein
MNESESRMNALLEMRLRSVAERRRRVRLWLSLAGCWAAAACMGLGINMVESRTGWAPSLALPLILAGAIIAALIVFARNRKSETNWRALAWEIERRFPELDGRLVTAVQQPHAAAAEAGYLQQRLLSETIRHGEQNDWAEAVPSATARSALAVHWVAVALLAAAMFGLRSTGNGHGLRARESASSIQVTPGDTSLERGNSLVVLARFAGALPPNVDLVANWPSGASRRIALVKSLADPMFGGSLTEVASNLVYHVEYGGRRTRDFQVSVYEHPRLERSDASLVYPAYTRQSPQTIENTRRVTAVTGSRLTLDLRLNKPVKSARLEAKDDEHSALVLRVETNRAAASLDSYSLEASKTYLLRLVDAEGRTNKAPAQFVFEALTNRTPEIRLASPRGDLRPSPLEEISFEGTVWDDFGVEAFGLGYSLVGQEPKSIELGRAIPGKEKRAFHYLLRLEDLGVKPDELVSWFVWADDIGPDGQLRHTTGDLFFGEVRPFEEIFREGQAADAPADSASQQGNQQGGASGRLAELEKQIISATWKLERAPGTPRAAADAGVVRDSQAQALEQARATQERQEDPRTTELWGTAARQMQEALDKLNQATNSPAAPTALPSARASEQAAYQTLLRLQEHEYQVARSRNQRNGGRGQQMQRQLDQLDLAQTENRYETQRQAQAPATTQQREQLQIMSRLQDLARRQQDLNERLKELQTALQEARTEQERADIQRRLKRLEEEEQQTLADVDELRQRMDQPENQSRLGEERRQLDQTREDVERAAQAAGQGEASPALAAGTRAQRQFQQMRDQIRRESSSQFADDLRQMRNDARELSRQQEELAKSMASEAASPTRSLSDNGPRESMLNQLARQKELLTNLLVRASAMSQQAEEPEPLLARQLYDMLRKYTQDSGNELKGAQDDLLNRGLLSQELYDELKDNPESEGAKLLDLTAEMVRRDFPRQAQDAGQRAGAGIDTLKRGVERAAESVVGDDTEALRLAQQELNQLTGQLEHELAQASAGGSPTNAGLPGGQTNLAQAGLSEGRNVEPASRSSGAELANDSAGGAGGRDWDRLLNNNGGPPLGPLTGADFVPWSDGLRDVEEMVEQPYLRNGVAAVRDRARVFRQDYKRTGKKPDWAVVRLQVLEPLNQVRDGIADELARRGSQQALVPLDRDPVPGRYSELVRRYYEELGKR